MSYLNYIHFFYMTSNLYPNNTPISHWETKTFPLLLLPSCSISNVQDLTASQRCNTSDSFLEISNEDLPHDGNTADYADIRGRSSHAATSFQKRSLASASPLIIHDISPSLIKNGACEDIGATLISDEIAIGTAAMHGGALGRANRLARRSRLTKKGKYCHRNAELRRHHCGEMGSRRARPRV